MWFICASDYRRQDSDRVCGAYWLVRVVRAAPILAVGKAPVLVIGASPAADGLLRKQDGLRYRIKQIRRVGWVGHA